MLTREGYPTWPGGAQPKRKIFGHLAIALAAFCQLEEENNLFGTHFDMQYQVHLRKHSSYSTHSASKVKDEQMAENYKAGATLPLSPLTNVPSSATKFGLNSTQLNSTPCEWVAAISNLHPVPPWFELQANKILQILLFLFLSRFAFWYLTSWFELSTILWWKSFFLRIWMIY